MDAVSHGEKLNWLLPVFVTTAEEKRQKRQSVFDFLNNALSQKPSEGEGGYKDGQKRPASSSVAGQQDTNQPPEKAAKKSLNVQVMEVYDEILAQERAIQRHRAVLKRQQGEMKERSEKILAEMEDNLQELQKKKAKLEKTTDSKRNLKKFLRF
eukprot:m.207298 g.207298  ORF g.207298 m.207298 type:complete len:154 (+) comp16916_c0_seq18:551-1012(+)